MRAALAGADADDLGPATVTSVRSVASQGPEAEPDARSRPAGRGAAGRGAAGRSGVDRQPGRSRTAPARGRAAPRPAAATGWGVLWAALLVTSTAVAPVLVAVVVVPVAVVAAASMARTPGATGPRVPLWAGFAAGVVPLAAVGGPVAAVTTLVLVVIAVGFATRVSGDLTHPAVGLGRLAAAVVAPGAAAASAVLAGRATSGVAVSLAVAICLYDVANYVVGTGETGGVIGALAGIITVAVFAVFVAAVLDPPLSGAKPWVLCGLVAALAPLGVALGRRLARGARLPALLRLDSLLLAGPAWVVATEILLR